MFKVLENGTTPTRGSKYSACVDLYASHDCVIGAGETNVIGLGVYVSTQEMFVHVLDKEHREEEIDFYKETLFLQLTLHDSKAEKGLIQPSVKIINLDYEDEIKMIIHNPVDKHNFNFSDGMIGQYAFTHSAYEIKKGDKIAQIILLEHKPYFYKPGFINTLNENKIQKEEIPKYIEQSEIIPFSGKRYLEKEYPTIIIAFILVMIAVIIGTIGVLSLIY